MLSGHLHGGIIRLPGIGGLITPQAIPFPKYSGEMTTEGEQTIIVSRGLGTHTINLRFLNEAEMIVIHLRGEKTVENLKDFPYNETQCEITDVDGRNKTDGDTGKIAGF